MIESFAAATCSNSLGIITTLLLYEKGAKPHGVLSQHFIHLILHKDKIQVAELISGYIEAIRMSKGKNSSMANCLVNSINYRISL